MYLQTSAIGTHLSEYDKTLDPKTISGRLSVTIIQH